MTRQRRAAGRGFTLIEVLVALAIVTVGMAAVLGTLTSSADTVAYLRDKTFATWVALNQIATTRLSVQTPTGKSDGDVDFAGRKWHWQQVVTALQVPGMARIEVSVRPADVKVSDDDRGWYTTMSGLYGDAVAQPRGDLDWGSQLLMPQTPGAGGTQGAPGGPNIITPGTPGAPGTQPAPQPVPPVPPTSSGGSS